MGLFKRIIQQFHSEKPEQRKAEYRWLMDKVRQHRRQILAVCALGFTGTLMTLASSIATKHLIDAVTGQGTAGLAAAAAGMIGMMLGGLVFQAASSRIGASVHVHVRHRMQGDTYGRILRASWQALEPYRSGDLMNRLNSDIGTVADGVIHFLPGLVSSAVKFAGAFGIMLYYDPCMALIALIGAPVAMALSRSLTTRIRRHSLNIKELSGEVMSFQEDSFRNLTSIKAFSVTDRYEEEMHRLQREYADAFLSFQTFQIGLSSCLSLVSMLITSACFGWGVYRLWTGSITYGALTMFLQLATALRGAFSALVALLQQLISISTSAGRIMAVEALPVEDMETPAGFREERQFAVTMEQVSFEYQNGDAVLDTFDFSAGSGDQIAVIGPSGEGKTTLLRLLLGLVAPCAGSIQLTGSSGTVYPVSAGTRSVFAYVPQGNSIFAGTVEENLRIVCPDATREEMEEALRTACAWEFVSQFPDGLKHLLGAGGRGISEGQAQRLAIARALLRKAPILLLDEATSGLDERTERQLLHNLRQSGFASTCILVTHRPESARFCSRTYEIRNGRVTELTGH